MNTNFSPRRHRPLTSLTVGESGHVGAITDLGPVGQRLLALGLVPGCPIRFLGKAPLGDPWMIEIPGSVFSLRKTEAALIELREPTP